MQTAPRNEKGRHAGHVTTPMQTSAHCADVRTNVQTPPAPKPTPRHHRLILALLAGPVTREEVDSIVGASNGPDEVLRARRRFNLVIPCERKTGRDRDGHRVEFGVYSLTRADRAKARKLVHGRAAA